MTVSIIFIESRAKAYRQLFSGHMPPHLINQVREAANKGLALGNDRFREEIEVLSGRRVTARKPGPGPKKGQ